MALKSIFSAMKREGYIVKDLDLYLMSENEESDRAINVNAPSQIGKCVRERFYARLGYPHDNNSVDARTQRIFDNGTHVHLRLQNYLSKQGMLLLDEIPVCNQKYLIQGHTDGLLQISKSEKCVLEIKSINSNGFAQLKTAKEEHKKQGLIYVYCIEQRRKYLHETYKSMPEFIGDKPNRMKSYAEFYKHLKDGNTYSKKEKVRFQCDLHNKMDTILMSTPVPITKVIFLYENKDNQELKEFCISTLDANSKVILGEILAECAFLNDCVAENKVPDRCAKNKSDSACRWCPYSIECWN